MPFRKGNKLGAKKQLDRETDKQPICFIGYKGQREAIKVVPKWQEKLREYVDILIASQSTIKSGTPVSASTKNIPPVGSDGA